MSLYKRLFATKSIELLHKEMAEDEGRLRRVLGPVGLTSLGVGAIIGAGIFVMTGRVAADNAGPAVMLSYVVAGIGCALAAFCYAEFASMVPVAGSAYTYAYATLGELIAWIIGWDLILEYAMSAATVGSAWSEYFNKFTEIAFDWKVPEYLSYDPFSKQGAWFNLPAVVILILVTIVLVIGIRESAASNTILVCVKLGVVIFVILVGAGYVMTKNWTGIPIEERKLAQQQGIGEAAKDIVQAEESAMAASRKLMTAHIGQAAKDVMVQIRAKDQAGTSVVRREVPDHGTGENSKIDEDTRALARHVLATYMIKRANDISAERLASGKESAEEGENRKAYARQLYGKLLSPQMDENRTTAVLNLALEKAKDKEVENWGLLGSIGLNKQLSKVDDGTRTTFTPYGLSGIMLGAALVFFAFIGFDSISTHSEEAVRPQRDVPIGILASLFICTILYMGVSAVITGMKPYPEINTEAAIASAFSEQANAPNVTETEQKVLKLSSLLIAAGGLAGMTSVLLITFLSQARVFLAMARDGFMPKRIFGSVHAKFKTPHISTMVTGAVIAAVAAFTPIQDLEKMVNIGTLFAFVIVCGAVLLLRIRRPEVPRPFRCPIVFVIAPLGILVNVTMMLFLPLMTWLRLFAWLLLGLGIYFAYGYWNSSLRKSSALAT